MPFESARRTFDRIITDGGAPLGTFITSTDHGSTLVAGSAGMDFVVIDGEHGPLDVSHKAHHISAARAHGIVPILRILANNPALVQQALDMGAGGIIVPKVGTADEAERAVRASRYQPGGRGMCPAVPAMDWNGSGWPARATDANAGTLVIPLIETAQGVRNIREIAAVDGVDHVFYGLADLSQDMGIDWVLDRDRLVEIWIELRDALHDEGVRAGAPHGFGFEGADFGTAGSDLSDWRTTCVNNIERFRAASHFADAGAALGKDPR